MSDWPILGIAPLTVLAAQSPFPVPAYAIDQLIIAASAGPSSPTLLLLPPATGSGKEVTVMKVDQYNNVAISTVPNETDTINGQNQSYDLLFQYSAVTFFDYALGQWLVF